MIQVNRIYLIFNRLVTKKFLVDTSDILYYMKSMIKIAKSILPLLGLLLSLSLSAQDVAVKGHVKDHTGEPTDWG